MAYYLSDNPQSTAYVVDSYTSLVQNVLKLMCVLGKTHSRVNTFRFNKHKLQAQRN